MKKIVRIKVIIFVFVILVVGIIFTLGTSNSVLLEDGSQVEPNSELVYYLDISYDGVDKYGIASSNNVKADIKSGYIYVEDIIPSGLIFNGFVQTEDGSIGAYDRLTGEMCLGSVVDDSDGLETLYSYHGLHFDEGTNKVSFRVAGLQAGCVLTVGIKTITPTMGDEHRKDFYNTAISQENDFNTTSNTVHAWMGVENVPTFKVNYVIEGDVPEDIIIPNVSEYVMDSVVSVSSIPSIYGYEFSGWTSNDVNINAGIFTMPGSDVTLKGSFSKIPKYELKYEIDGIKPDNYIVPLTKEYYDKEIVSVDSLKKGTVIDGYEFLGWTDDDGNLVEKNIIVDANDVILTGKFKVKTFNLSYKFYDTVLPPNGSDYLPDSVEVVPGTSIKLPDVNDVEGYEFVCWYKENNFIMPNNDVVVYGEWKTKVEYFEPRIDISIKPEHDILHKEGSEVEFEVKVFNDQPYAMKEVYVGNNLDGVELIVNDSLGVVASDSIVLINEIPANSFASYKSIYKVSEKDFGTIDNEVEILSVLADGNREMNTDIEYKATDDLEIMTSINICNSIINSTSDDKTKFIYRVSGENYNKTIELGNEECEVLYVEPGKYSVLQENIKNYKIAEILEGIKNNGDTFNLLERERINIKFVNELIVLNPNTSSSDKMLVKFLMFLDVCVLFYIFYQSKIKKESI